jgi:signal transduction histidine kinase
LMQKKAKIAMRRKYSFSMDIRITTPGRPMRYLHTDTQSLVNDKGEVYKIYGTMRDITESKQLDEAQSDFLALASHQLRTPATVVKQYLALILEGYTGKLAQKQKEFIEKAYIGNERQIRIVNDMLRIANLDAGKIKLNKSIVDMVDLMNDILKDYRANLDPEVHKIKFNTRHNEMLCNIDSEYIRMAVENIIDNAIKYTNREANITITLVKSKGKICLSIADKGLGMEKAEARKIFQKFYRIHNQYTIQAGGSGLGLYWVARVVAMHKGRVEVDSKLGRGSSFTLLLPASLPANYVA